MRRMDKKFKRFSLFLVALLLMGLASSLVRANFKPAPLPPIIINSDGEVIPFSDLINRNGDVYTFTGNWTAYFLEIERSDIVIHGEGFFIVGNGVGYGIKLNDVSNVSISHVNLAETNVGIYLENSSKVTIDSCSVADGSYGIYLKESKNNIILGNRLSSFYSIYLDHSGSNTLKNNQIKPHGLNFMVTGDLLADYINYVDSSNLIDGKSIIYWVSRQNTAVPSNSSCVVLVNCKSIVVQNQQISNTQGILIAWTTNSTVTSNRLYENFAGIQVLHSSCIMVNGNQITENTGLVSGGDGINLVDSQFVTVVNNQAKGNWNGGITCNNSSKNQIIGNAIDGNKRNGINLMGSSDFNLIAQNHLFNHTTNSRGAIYIEDSRNNNFVSNNLTDNGCWAIQLKGNQGNNTFYGNNFIHNSYRNTRNIPGAIQISTPGTANANFWDNGSFGNYWSDYDGDGKYLINENNIDHYPLNQQVDINSIAPIPTINTGPNSVSINHILTILEIFTLIIIIVTGSLLLYRHRRRSDEQS
jgi:parallel beta-helix repeat protein